MDQRKYPSPWQVDNTGGGHLIVRDDNELPLAYAADSAFLRGILEFLILAVVATGLVLITLL
jgi:hypothetical protein